MADLLLPNFPKSKFQSVPNARGRSGTITTPVGTPADGLSEFLTQAQLQDLLRTSRNHWEKLPRELKLHVLSFLPAVDRIRCRKVNRELLSLSKDGSLWKSLDTSCFNTRAPAAALLELIDCAAPFVQYLNIRGCAQLSPLTMFNLTGLLQASLEGCRFFNTKSLSFLLSRNARLQSLDLSGLTVVSDSVLFTLAESCSQLRHLNISSCLNISANGLERLLHKITDVRDLRIAECPLSDSVMLALSQLKHLARLSLSDCRNLFDHSIKLLIYGTIEYGVLFPETRVQSPLRHLDLSRCSSLTTSFLQYMRCTLPNLQKLELAGMTMLTDDALIQTLPHLSSLTHVDLEDCAITDASLIALTACPLIRHIQLSHCGNISDYGLLSLVENLQLNHLDLDNTTVTNRVLSTIASTPREMRISIYDCPNITWTGVLSILTANSANPSALKRLKTFYGWQRPVDGHTKRVRRGDLVGAREIEKEWAIYMMSSSEDVLRTGEGRTRFLDFDDEGSRIIGRQGRRARMCEIM